MVKVLISKNEFITIKVFIENFYKMLQKDPRLKINKKTIKHKIIHKSF